MLWENTPDISNVIDTIVENQLSVIELPITDFDTIELISGNIPSGMYIDANNIIGIPDIVAEKTRYSFALRATKDDTIDDSSFSIDVIDKNPPEWITPSGILYVNSVVDDLQYVPDGHVIKHQLLATDEDIETGELLKFYISDGELPIGLEMDNTGLIHGITGIQTQLNDDSPVIDFSYEYPHPDFFISGYHSNFYDLSDRDEIIANNRLYKKLGKQYDFEVSVYDGKTIPVPRQFSIIVAGDEVYKDFSMPYGPVVSMYAFHAGFCQWLTNENLGLYKSNINVTIYLDCIDHGSLTGFARYTLGVDSELPNGLVLDEERGIIHGKTPKIHSPRQDYVFEINALALGWPNGVTPKTFNLSIIHDNYVDFYWESTSYLGKMTVYEKSFLKLKAISSNDTKVEFKLINGDLPPGLELYSDGSIIGNVIPFDSGIEPQFTFTVKAFNINNTLGVEKTFVLDVDTLDGMLYNDVYISILLSDNDRSTHVRLLNTINNASVYRVQDEQLGLNYNMDMLFFSYIEKVNISEYYELIKTFRRRRLKFNGIKNIEVFLPGTKTLIYEMVYVELLDPFANSNNALALLRERIAELGETNFINERLWLYALKQQYNNDVIALPLVFVKPGHGDNISYQINSIDHNINDYEFDIDRLIVSSPIDNDSYVMFSHREPQTSL